MLILFWQSINTKNLISILQAEMFHEIVVPKCKHNSDKVSLEEFVNLKTLPQLC